MYREVQRQIEGERTMNSDRNGVAKALASGLIGASVVTLLHETARRIRPDAPRMDVLGMRGLAALMGLVDVEPPKHDRLHSLAMGADVVSNGLYYSMVGSGDDRVWLRGVLLGIAAGVGGVALPPMLGLGAKPSARTRPTKIMTFTWYFAGGIAAAASSRLLDRGSGR